MVCHYLHVRDGASSEGGGCARRDGPRLGSCSSRAGNRGGRRGLSHVLSQSRSCRAGVGDSQDPICEGKAVSHPLALAIHPPGCPKAPLQQSTQRFPGFSRGLSTMKVSQVLLLPADVEVLADMVQSWRTGVPVLEDRSSSPRQEFQSWRLPLSTGFALPLSTQPGHCDFSPSFATSKLFKLPVLWGRNYSSIKHPACVGYYLDMLL